MSLLLLFNQGGGGSISGSSAGSSTLAGVLAGVLALSGASAGQAGQTGTLTGIGALAGTSTGISTVTGTLDIPPGFITGTAAGSSWASGVLTGQPAGGYLDARERVLVRLQETLKAVTPEATVTFVDGFTSDPFLTDLGGRVYTRRRGDAKVDESECPYVELVTGASKADGLRWLDGTLYSVTLPVTVVGYLRETDAPDDLNSDLHWRLIQLGADLRMALEAAPDFVPSGGGASLRKTLGSQVRVVVESQDVSYSPDLPYGNVVIEVSVQYVTNARYS